jgi:hypothetical protein
MDFSENRSDYWKIFTLLVGKFGRQTKLDVKVN